jgi:hypothetical protein
MYKLGRKAIKTDSRTKRLSHYLTSALPTPPATLSWHKNIPNWGNMKNNILGDCTIAACGHAIQIWSVNIGNEITISDDDIVKTYSAWDGYDPADPTTDCGGIELDVLNDWRRETLCGHKLLAFTAVNQNNINEVKTAIYLFGGMYIGLSLPISAQNQSTWDVTTDNGFGNTKPGSWGGHAVYICAYDNEGLTCITWGQLMKITWPFWNKYCDESYGILGGDWLNNAGINPSGFAVDKLLEDIALIK